MANTRYFYDDCRTQKAIDESTYTGNYFLNTPGNAGTNPYLYSDPHIRQQFWGGNLSLNKTELESDLKGITRKLNKDIPQKNDYLEYSKNNLLYNKKFSSVYHNEITSQSRATNPAWTYREIDNFNNNVPNNFKYLHLDPQENTCIPFNHNVQSRIVEKDYYAQNNH